MDFSTTFASLRKQVAGFSVVTLVAGMLATGVASAATANIFSDVPADAWFSNYVNELANAGVIDSTKSMYMPGDLVKRSEMAKFAFMVSGLALEKAPAAPFKDVAMGQWYTDYAYTLQKNGVISGDKVNGVPNGMFRPSDNLNRAEATKMLVNAAQMAEDLKGAPHFPDVKSSDWFFNFVETAFNNGVVAGYPDGNFRPANNINRAEAAKMVYLSMDMSSTAGFRLSSAAAASSTKVELIFSMDVEKASSEMMANYDVMDSAGVKLAVSKAEMISADTVHLTTATQTAGMTYKVVVKNVKSTSGDSLVNTDPVSFLAYGSDVTGGDLMVSLSTQTPVSGAVPTGATGVVFTCWDAKAGATDAMVKSLRVHRVGPGSQTAFSNVYLYRGDARLTTGRSINSETQMVEFNNINQTVKAGENAKLCLVGDLTTTAQGGVHAFEIVAAADVMSNSKSMTGSFPLRGADQLITTATVGTTTITKNGSLDELTLGQKNARISQFQLTADGAEDQMLTRVALYISGAINTSEVTNLRLYSTDDSVNALATTASVGAKALATFKLDKPFKVARGNNKVFFVVADIGGRDGDTVKTYLDTPTDLFVTGVTYGYGTRVKSSTVDTGSYDGAGAEPNGNFSFATVKGGVFNIAFTGPTSGDVASGQKQAKCLAITIANNGDADIEIRDWPMTLDVLNVPTAGGGLVDTTPTPAIANYSLIKLAKLNADGTIAGSLLGPSELSITPGDATQVVTLSGTANIAAKSSVKAAVVFDVRSANAAMANDQIRCTIAKGLAKGLVDAPNAVKNTVQNKQLDEKSITPAAPIVGNIFTVKPGALTVSLSSTPSTQTYTRGSANVALAGFAFTAGSSLDQTIKSLTLTGQISGDNGVAFSAAGVGTHTGLDTTASILSNVIDSGVALYDGATMVSEIKNINATTGKVVFNNLNISVAKSSTKNLILKGSVSNSAPFGTLADKVKFSVQTGADLIIIDQNNQNVDAASIVTTLADQTAVNSVVMTLTASGNGTVAQSTSDNAKAVAGTTDIVAAKWTFTSVNDNPLLKDLDLLVLNSSSAAVSKVKLYKDSACTLQVGSVSGYTPLPSGVVQVRDLNEVVTSSSTYTLCAKVTTSIVQTDPAVQPVSGSNVGLGLLNVTKVSSGSGLNVASRYAGSALGVGTVLTTNIDAVCGSFAAAGCNALANTLGANVEAGDVIQIDGELLRVTSAASTTPTFTRNFAGTLAATHTLGSDVTKSTVATRVVLAADVKAGDVYSNGVFYCLALTDSGVTFADLDSFDGAVGGCIAPVAAHTRFPLHGNLSKLYRSVPQITNLTPAGAPAIAPSSNATLLSINVKATGDKVKFANNSATASVLAANIGALAANADNQLVVKFDLNTASTEATASSCVLVNASNGDQPLATVAIPATTATGFVLAFRFDTSSLTIDQDATVNLQVRCNAAAMVGVVAQKSVTATLVSDAKTVEWSDFVQSDILGAGKLLLNSDMTGYTARNAS